MLSPVQNRLCFATYHFIIVMEILNCFESETISTHKSFHSRRKLNVRYSCHRATVSRTRRVALYLKVGLFPETFYFQAHSFYETLQKSKFSVKDIKENMEVRARNKKGVLMIIRGRTEHDFLTLINIDQNNNVINIVQMQ